MQYFRAGLRGFATCIDRLYKPLTCQGPTLASLIGCWERHMAEGQTDACSSSSMQRWLKQYMILFNGKECICTASPGPLLQVYSRVPCTPYGQPMTINNQCDDAPSL